VNEDARKDNSLIGAAGVHYAAYKLRKQESKAGKFPLCIWVDRGAREQK
jgi:hypothetical protein